MTIEIGQRIAQRIDETRPTLTRKQFAEQVGMTPDALSRALSSKRAFSTLELVRIASVLDADMYELITGTPDPRRLTLTARHDYNHANGARQVPTFENDQLTLEQIRLAYAQAELALVRRAELPQTEADMRVALGDDFVRPFITRIEQRLGIDVIRLKELGTAYSLELYGRKVIAIPAKGNWFRENWDLAHELAHLAGEKSEAAANAFAAEFLLPESLVRAVDWQRASQGTLADFLWDTGVSTEALKNRLDTLEIGRASLGDILNQPTQRVLRQSRTWSPTFGDEITNRMDAASDRRFPLSLQEAHEKKIEDGVLGTSFLAWMRGIDETWVADAYEQHDSSDRTEELAEALALSLG